MYQNRILGSILESLYCCIDTIKVAPDAHARNTLEKRVFEGDNSLRLAGQSCNVFNMVGNGCNRCIPLC
jgi:hypothetical protein